MLKVGYGCRWDQDGKEARGGAHSLSRLRNIRKGLYENSPKILGNVLYSFFENFEESATFLSILVY
jgi:hypothetical protein